MADPPRFFISPLSRGPFQNDPLVVNSDGGVLTSPSRAILRIQHDGEPIPFSGIDQPRVITLRPTFDSNFSFTPTSRPSSSPSSVNHSIRGSIASLTRHIRSSITIRNIRLQGPLWAVFCLMYSFGTYRIFFTKFKFREQGQSSPEAIHDSSYAQWVKTVRRMCSFWRLARVGCGLLLPLSIALLQIDSVIKPVFVRTCTITTAIFAAAGLLSSGIYLFLRSEFKNQRTRIKWVEASRRSMEPESIEFWTFLALPLAALVWAILSCAITVVCLAWTRPNGAFQETTGSFIGSAVFITTLTVMTLVHLYKAAQLLDWV